MFFQCTCRDAFVPKRRLLWLPSTTSTWRNLEVACIAFSEKWTVRWLPSTCGSIPGVQSLYLPRRRWDLWRGDSSRSWLGRKEYWDAAYASGRYKHTYAPRMERFKRCDMTQDWTVSCGFQWLYQFAVDNLTSCQSTFSLSCLVHL